jgi:hypothetical protein
VATEAERDRAASIISHAAAQGIRLACHIEVRPDGNPQKEGPADPTLRSPAEPA